MHSLALVFIISGAALASASHVPDETLPYLDCPGSGGYYVCHSNGFRGYCSSDPCDTKDWCPDFVDRTCTRKPASSSSVLSSASTSASTYVYPTVASSTARTSTSIHHSSSTTSKATSLTTTRSYSNSTSTGYHTSSNADDCSETSHTRPTSTKHWTDVTKSTEASKTGSKPPVTHTTAYSSNGPYVTPSHSHGYSSVPSPSPSPCPSCDNKCPPATLPGCLQPAANYNYYICASNGYKGHCTSDPCGKAWCPDFKQGTCEAPRPEEQCTIPTVTLTVTAVPSPYSATKSTSSSATATATPGGKGSYHCSSNGFHGTCSVNPCALTWCPDYKDKTYEAATVKRDETVCPAGTGYFQSCGNGFRGCCKSDACGSATNWCADYKPGTFQPVSSGFTTSSRAPAEPTERPSPAGGAGSNGGAWSDPTVCAPGTGYFQTCGNGFRGCCKSDACTLGYCPSN